MIFTEKSLNAVSRVRERDFSFLRSISIAAAAFFLSVSPLFGKLSPFGVAFIGTLSGFDCIFGFCGAVTGFAASGNFGLAVPHIAVIAALSALRLILGHKRNIGINLASAVLASVGIFIAHFPSSSELSDIFTGFAFGVITFISVTSANTFLAAKDKPFTDENTSLILSGAVIYTLIITAFSGLQLGFFNAGIFLSALAIVIAPKVRDNFAVHTGILSAAGITLANPSFSIISIILGVSALLSSFLGKYGRITRGCGLVFALGFGILVTGITEESTVCTASVLMGAAGAMLVPEKYIPSFKNRCYIGVASASRPFYVFGRKLECMSDAVGEMNTAIKRTAEALDKENIHDPSQIYINAADSICTGCRNNMYCWGSCYNRSSDILNKAVSGIRQGVLADENTLGGHFEEVCPKRKELADALNRGYAVYCSAQSSARKIGEMRSVLSSQLSATQRMLKKISEELCTDDGFDEKAAYTASEALKESGILNPTVTAINIEGKLTIDAFGEDTPLFNPQAVAKRISFALRKEFDPPLISETSKGIRITLSERSLYDAQIKTFSRSKSDSNHSGDCFDCFNDGQGNLYMILSDGMGSGARAKIDSTFSCSMLVKMLKAGIDFDAAMEMLNTSLMVKSSDESFATLDVCRINLYSGEISLYKAGSASTFIRKGATFSELSGSGIPFGVTEKAEYYENRFTVSFGDIIIMTSDGADIDKDWLERVVMREKNADLNTIISLIGDALRLSAERGKEDDITVIGVKITK